MKNTLLGTLAAVVLTSLPVASHADASFNIGAVTDYRYRGISQTRLKPALQGGFDYSNGGFYVGTWASTIEWIKDFGGDAKVEIDLYGGYKGEIAKDFTYDVGVLTYQYPSNKMKPIGGANANTTEIYGALTYGPATLKYSHAVTDTFANFDSKGSFYVDLSATFEVSGLSVVPHVGYQKIKGPFEDPGSYTDYSLTISKELEAAKGLTLSAAVVGTDADKAFYVSPKNGKELGKPTLVLGVKYVYNF